MFFSSYSISFISLNSHWTRNHSCRVSPRIYSVYFILIPFFFSISSVQVSLSWLSYFSFIHFFVRIYSLVFIFIFIFSTSLDVLNLSPPESLTFSYFLSFERIAFRSLFSTQNKYPNNHFLFTFSRSFITSTQLLERSVFFIHLDFSYIPLTSFHTVLSKPSSTVLQSHIFPSMVNSFNTLLDSRCTRHVVRDRALFRDYAEKSITVGTATCGFLEALGSGDMEFRYRFRDRHVIFTLRGCLYVPTAPTNLISVGTWLERGMSCPSLYSSDGITDVFYSDQHPKFPGLAFTAAIVNRLSFLFLDFISPVQVSPAPLAFPARVSPPVAVSPSQSVSLPSSSSSLSSRRNLNTIPHSKTKSKFASPHYLIVDCTLPSHIFNDRSLFTTYTPGRKVHRTAFGHDSIIEGTGEVNIRVHVAGQYIYFRMQNCWHVPSSPHHFLSCSTVVSLGHQVMIAGRSPRLIYSHKRRLVQPNLPKYMPFTRVHGLLGLEFSIPTHVPILSQPTSTGIQSTIAPPFLSLHASNHPFAGLTFDRNPLPNPQEGLCPLVDGSDAMAAVDAHTHADLMSNTGTDVVLHGGANVDSVSDVPFPLPVKDDAVDTMHGGGDAPLLMQLYAKGEGTVLNGDTASGDQAVNAYGGKRSTRLMINFLDTLTLSQLLSLNSLNLQVENNFNVHLSSLSSPYTSRFSQSFTSVLNIDLPCFSYSSLSFYNSSVSSLSLLFNFNNKARCHYSFSSFSRNKFSSYLPFPFSTIRLSLISFVYLCFEVSRLSTIIFQLNSSCPILYHHISTSSTTLTISRVPCLTGVVLQLLFTHWSPRTDSDSFMAPGDHDGNGSVIVWNAGGSMFDAWSHAGRISRGFDPAFRIHLGRGFAINLYLDATP